MTTLLGQAAVLVPALGLVAAAVVALRRRRVQPAVAVLSDFFLATGLIRLAGQPTWSSLLVAAAGAGLRVLLNVNLRALSARRDGNDDDDGGRAG